MSSKVFANAAMNALLYRTDGTGRDTYISTNNGGFSVSNEPYHFPPISRTRIFNFDLATTMSSPIKV